MSYSRALNYDKNYLVRYKEWKVAIHDWVPQSLESKTKHFHFPIYQPTASQGLYAPSPFGPRTSGFRTIASMIYNEAHGGHKKGHMLNQAKPKQANTKAMVKYSPKVLPSPKKSKGGKPKKKKKKVATKKKKIVKRKK